MIPRATVTLHKTWVVRGKRNITDRLNMFGPACTPAQLGEELQNILLCAREARVLFDHLHETIACSPIKAFFSIAFENGKLIRVTCNPGCKLLELHNVASITIAVCADRMGNREVGNIKEISEGDNRPHCYEALVTGHPDSMTFGDVISWERSNHKEDHIPFIVNFLEQLAETGEYIYPEEEED